MSVTLELLRQRIASNLCRIDDLLPDDYVLTLIARHKTNEDAHIVVTADDVDLAVKAVERTNKT